MFSPDHAKPRAVARAATAWRNCVPQEAPNLQIGEGGCCRYRGQSREGRDCRREACFGAKRLSTVHAIDARVSQPAGTARLSESSPSTVESSSIFGSAPHLTVRTGSVATPANPGCHRRAKMAKPAMSWERARTRLPLLSLFSSRWPLIIMEIQDGVKC
jgi:hypothetical protein